MYAKIFTQILDSSIADNRRLRHFFVDLILCADAKGYVMMTPAAVARRISAPIEEVEWGLEELMKPDPLSKTTDHEGRRIERVEGSGYGWRVLNYEHYRSMKDADQLRESTRERVKKYRERAAAKKNDDTSAVEPSKAVEKTPAETLQPAPLADQRAKSTRRDECFEWLVTMTGATLDSVTRTGRGAINAALKDIRQVSPSVTPVELECRAARYRARMPGAILSPSALAKYWGSLVEVAPRAMDYQQRAINAWFLRDEDSPWTDAEWQAWDSIPQPIPERTWQVISLHYTNPQAARFRKQSVSALLREWSSEVDKAFNYQPD